MIIGSFPFILLAQVSYKNPFILFKDQQIRLFILIITGLVISLYFIIGERMADSTGDKLVSISFNSISIITGTGYVSENFENWGKLLICAVFVNNVYWRLRRVHNGRIKDF